jgi:hypothetical protein
MPAKYLPDWISSEVKATGVHFMCILRKARARGLKGEDIKARLKELSEECRREGKYVPVKKLLIETGLVTA